MTAIRANTPSNPPYNIPFYYGLEEEGCYYFNARWYDAQTGRFISEDPARDGSNWHVYVSNNPLKYIDPTGLSQVEGAQKDDDERKRKEQERKEREQREAREKAERERKEQLEKHDPGAELPEEVNENLVDVIGEEAATYIKDPEMFTGVVGVGAFSGATAIVSGILEDGTAYVVEDGIVLDSFDYRSTSVGAESNVGFDARGEVITVIPDAVKDDFLGTSVTKGANAGEILFGIGGGIVETSTGKTGYSVNYSGALSISPLSFYAVKDKVRER